MTSYNFNHACSNSGAGMWVEFVCCERFFSRYSGFPLSPKTRNQVDKEPLRGCATSKSLLLTIKNELAVPRTMEEIKKAILHTNSGRTSGKDSIPVEIYKAAGPNALEAFHDVLQSIWEEEEIQDP